MDNWVKNQLIYLIIAVVVIFIRNINFELLLLILRLFLIVLAIAACVYIFYQTRKPHRDTEQRKIALKVASPYLAPYRDIWKNLRLSNKNCSLSLGRDGKALTLREKIPPYRSCKIMYGEKSVEDIWNSYCLGFTYNKTYENLIKESFQLGLYTVSTNKNHDNQPSQTNISKPITIQSNNTIYEKLDINNCSEAELTELPGISIVLAKKIIKKRDSIGGFKHIEDFFIFVKLKPHFEEQLRNRVCANKMKKAPKIERNTERNVDL